MDKVVSKLNDAPRKLFSTWENSFIDSVYRQTQAGKTLSKKQMIVLQRVYYKYQEWVVDDYDPSNDGYEIFHD